MRKIIQISAIPASTSELDSMPGGMANDETVYALCDDGSVFYILSAEADPKWEKLPPVPQDGTDAKVFLTKLGEDLFEEASIDQACEGWEKVKQSIEVALEVAYLRGRDSMRRPVSTTETWKPR